LGEEERYGVGLRMGRGLNVEVDGGEGDEDGAREGVKAWLSLKSLADQFRGDSGSRLSNSVRQVYPEALEKSREYFLAVRGRSGSCVVLTAAGADS
jgi:hypothetical protein